MTLESVTLKHKISMTTNPINFKSLLAPRYSSIVQEKNYSGYLARVLSAGDSFGLFLCFFSICVLTYLWRQDIHRCWILRDIVGGLKIIKIVRGVAKI